MQREPVKGTLVHKKDGDKDLYRWVNEKDEPVSPIFTCMPAAMDFPRNNQFLTDAQWLEKAKITNG